VLVRVTDVRVQRDRGRHADSFECQSAFRRRRVNLYIDLHPELSADMRSDEPSSASRSQAQAK
jgi:hypothetical protein